MELALVAAGALAVWYLGVSPWLKMREAVRQAQLNAHIYEYEGPHQTFKLDLSKMRMLKPSLRDAMLYSGTTDGEALMDANDIPETLEVRRVQSDRWETRLDCETWDSLREDVIARATKRIEERRGFLDHEGFEGLTGMKWREWKKWVQDGRAGDGPTAADPPSTRQWRALPDEFTPALETAYQRYLAGQPAMPLTSADQTRDDD